MSSRIAWLFTGVHDSRTLRLRRGGRQWKPGTARCRLQPHCSALPLRSCCIIRWRAPGCNRPGETRWTRPSHRHRSSRRQIRAAGLLKVPPGLGEEALSCLCVAAPPMILSEATIPIREMEMHLSLRYELPASIDQGDPEQRPRCREFQPQTPRRVFVSNGQAHFSTHRSPAERRPSLARVSLRVKCMALFGLPYKPLARKPG